MTGIHQDVVVEEVRPQTLVDLLCFFCWMVDPANTHRVCPMCENTGYAFGANNAGTAEPLHSLHITACYHPLCPLDRPPSLIDLQVCGMFRGVVHGPDGAILSINDFTKPVYR